jgi:hypothetical protein
MPVSARQRRRPDYPCWIANQLAAQLAEIPGVGKVSFDDIMQYRSRFVSASEGK